ncbi:hypothetical protein L1987_04845 [Smallanthus sonchifolius]|uniref:Uncharacterized protein n=1 Tax=Smallanthus sonchifolius TaxID=185202 RepID=A0ACB9JTN9_9ASTR|nr:hypothetical protein L1987_04845 [Smallanthus sonchifolius]
MLKNLVFHLVMLLYFYMWCITLYIYIQWSNLEHININKASMFLKAADSIYHGFKAYTFTRKVARNITLTTSPRSLALDAAFRTVSTTYRSPSVAGDNKGAPTVRDAR